MVAALAKIMADEKIWNVVWAGAALFLAYHTFGEILFEPEANLYIWLALHLLAACLFLIRNKPIQASSSWLGYGVALASVNYYLLYDLTPSAVGFSALGKPLMWLGGVLCLVATFSLGRCFGVLPIYRGIQTTWAYQVVRHPIYASYLVLDVGIVIVYPKWENILIFCVGGLLFVLRIRFEEEVLGHSQAYLHYKTQVRFKLIPKLY